jgi:endo-1,4-beta-xylanase
MKSSTQRCCAVVFCMSVAIAIMAPGDLAARTKYFGGIWQNSWTSLDSAPAFFTSFFDQVTPESAGKWGFVEPTRGNFNWSVLDVMYQWAEVNNAVVKQHTFVWTSSKPSWFTSITNADTVKKVVRTWITAYLKRYGSKIDQIDVVNEMISTNTAYKSSKYSEYLGGDGTTGWDWVIWAYQTARDSANKYAPNAQLLINENCVLNDNTRTTSYLALANLLKARNLIDGIGEQGHAFEKTDTAYMHRNLDRLATSGLPIYISELDVNDSTDQGQLASYKRLIPLFWNHPAVKGITIWGYQQGKIWQTQAYLERSDGTERPAFTWLKAYIGPKSVNSIENKKLVLKTRQESASVDKNRYRINGQRISSSTVPTGCLIMKKETKITAGTKKRN